ncbi:calcium-binding protein cml39 [Quercus suber]|uniref:Calcium-binding protein cml39 n=1 Tax=Quercus suber TaxID=58331 RepID=A0AAW0M4N1_QUESU
MGRKVTVYKPTSVLYTKDQLMNVFKSHDADGDGKLSREELKKAFKYLGSRWCSYRTEQALRCTDANDDGYIDEKELERLVDYTLERQYTIV